MRFWETKKCHQKCTYGVNVDKNLHLADIIITFELVEVVCNWVLYLKTLPILGISPFSG
mgnify:CR=1 FL=1